MYTLEISLKALKTVTKAFKMSFCAPKAREFCCHILIHLSEEFFCKMAKFLDIWRFVHFFLHKLSFRLPPGRFRKVCSFFPQEFSICKVLKKIINWKIENFIVFSKKCLPGAVALLKFWVCWLITNLGQSLEQFGQDLNDGVTVTATIATNSKTSADNTSCL